MLVIHWAKIKSKEVSLKQYLATRRKVSYGLKKLKNTAICPLLNTRPITTFVSKNTQALKKFLKVLKPASLRPNQHEHAQHLQNSATLSSKKKETEKKPPSTTWWQLNRETLLEHIGLESTIWKASVFHKTLTKVNNSSLKLSRAEMLSQLTNSTFCTAQWSQRKILSKHTSS